LTFLMSGSEGSERAPPEDRGSFEAGGSVASPPEPSWSYRPLQSLVGQRSSRLVGLPAPGPVLTLAERPTPPVFPASPWPTEATLWAILSWGSALLHGMSRSPRPRSLDQQAPLLGFLAPTALRARGVHGPPVTRRAPRSCRASVCGSHPAGYGAARRLSQPLSGLLPPSAVLPFPGRWRSWGSPFREFIHPRSPDDSSPPACPLDVPPDSWPSPMT